MLLLKLGSEKIGFNLYQDHLKSNEQVVSAADWIMGGSPSDVSEEPVTQEKRKKGLRMSCDVGEATEWFEDEL